MLIRVLSVATVHVLFSRTKSINELCLVGTVTNYYRGRRYMAVVKFSDAHRSFWFYLSHILHKVRFSIHHICVYMFTILYWLMKHALRFKLKWLYVITIHTFGKWLHLQNFPTGDFYWMVVYCWALIRWHPLSVKISVPQWVLFSTLQK